MCVFFSIVGKSINDRKRHNLIVLPEKSGKSLAVSTYLNHTWMTCYMFADMRVTFKIKFRSTCHIYNFSRHEMIGVPTHEATNSKNVQTYIYIYMSHAKNQITLAINGNTIAALWKKWHQKQNNNQQTITSTWCSQPSTTYNEPIMFEAQVTGGMAWTKWEKTSRHRGSAGLVVWHVFFLGKWKLVWQ